MNPAAGQVREFPIYSLESPAQPTALKDFWPLSSCLRITWAIWLSHCVQVIPGVPSASPVEVFLKKDGLVNTSCENLG